MVLWLGSLVDSCARRISLTTPCFRFFQTRRPFYICPRDQLTLITRPAALWGQFERQWLEWRGQRFWSAFGALKRRKDGGESWRKARMSFRSGLDTKWAVAFITNQRQSWYGKLLGSFWRAIRATRN